MPDPVVVIELTLDSTPLFGMLGDCRVAFWFRDGFNNIPTIRGEDVLVPGRSGRIARNRIADVLAVPLSGWLVVPDGLAVDAARAAFRSSMRTLQTLLAGLDVVVLEAALEDGSIATLNVRVEPPVLVREQPAGLGATIDVDLRSVDPSWVITPAGS